MCVKQFEAISCAGVGGSKPDLTPLGFDPLGFDPLGFDPLGFGTLSHRRPAAPSAANGTSSTLSQRDYPHPELRTLSFGPVLRTLNLPEANEVRYRPPFRGSKGKRVEGLKGEGLINQRKVANHL